MLAMIGTRLALCVLLLASIAMSASSTDSEWLPPVPFAGQTSSNGQSVIPTTIQALPAPRPVFTTTMTQTQTQIDTKTIISAATIPTAEGTLTHPFSSSTSSSLSHPFSSSSSMTHPFSSSSSRSSSHSSAAVELPVNLLSATFVVVVVGSVLAALF